MTSETEGGEREPGIEMAHIMAIKRNEKIPRSSSFSIRRLRPSDWARMVAHLTMCHGALFFIGCTIVLFVRLCGYNRIHQDHMFFALVSMAVSAGEVFYGRHLLNGINEENHYMLRDWLYYTLFVQIGSFLTLIVLLLVDPTLNLEWVFNILGSVLFTILNCICIYLVNNHRKELKLRLGQKIEAMEMEVM